MDKKIYKGVIQSILPQKGFGFISPVWANGDSEENIFFHLSETKGGKCFIPALASAEDRTEFTTKKGVKTFIPKEAQVVFFELETEGKRFAAKKIRDAKHVSEEEAEAADQNTEKPTLDKTTTEEVNLVVTKETIKVEEPVEEEAACEAVCAVETTPMVAVNITTTLAALEFGLANAKKPQKKEKIKYVAKEEPEEEEEDDDTTPSEYNDCKVSYDGPAMSIYTEEELRKIEEEEKYEDEEEDIDYDEYDEYEAEGDEIQEREDAAWIKERYHSPKEYN